MGTTPYGKRALVAVRPTGTASFMYGFRTNTTEAQRTLLGQVPAMVNGVYIPGLVIGANSPKPARVKKYRTGGGWDNSFCDATKIDEALTGGWTLTRRSSRRGAASSARSKCVFIKIGAVDEGGNEAGPQIKYAWRMPQFLFEKITAADRTALGIELATNADTDLVFGASYPSPPKATFTAVGENGFVGHRTTFCDPKKLDSLPNGWTPAKTSGYA